MPAGDGVAEVNEELHDTAGERWRDASEAGWVDFDLGGRFEGATNRLHRHTFDREARAKG